MKASLLAQMSHNYECSVILLLNVLGDWLQNVPFAELFYTFIVGDHVSATYSCAYIID